MPDIRGTTGANFTFTVSAATIVTATLLVPGKPHQSLTVGGSGREVTVLGLPAGDSVVQLDLVWAPGDTDAVIDIGTVGSGTVTVASPTPTLAVGITPGFVNLYSVGPHGTDEPPPPRKKP